MIESTRTFLAIVPGDKEAGNTRVTVNEILFPKPNDWEFIYAVGEFIGTDKLLDMKMMDVVKFPGNRDSRDEPLSLLIRIK